MLQILKGMFHQKIIFHIAILKKNLSSEILLVFTLATKPSNTLTPAVL